MLKTFLFFVLFFNSLTLASSFDSFKNFPIQSPLSYKSIRTISQDSDDYMWFGSQEGLHRYDGYDIKTYLHDNEKPTSLSSDVVSRIMFDSKDRLWVATRGGGLSIFRPESDDFFHIKVSTEPYNITDDNINTIIEDSLGKIWVGTEKGLNILKENKPNEWSVQQINVNEPNGLTHNTIHSLLQTSKGEVWAGTNGGGVSVFDLQGKFLRSVNFKPLSENENIGHLINKLYEDSFGNIWIGTIENGLIKYSQLDGKYLLYTHIPNDKNSVNSNTIEYIFEDSKRQLWIATDKGLSIYHHDTDLLTNITHSSSNPFSLANDFVLTVFEDKHNMIWIGTFSGISRWDPHMATFKRYDQTSQLETSSHLVTSFSELSNSNLAISAYDGLIYQLNTKEDKVESLITNDFFNNYRISTLYADNENLWIGTRSSGLFKLNLTTRKIKNYRHNKQEPKSISANSITDIFKDREGNIWISTYHNGFNLLNHNDTFDRFTVDGKYSESPNSHHILQIEQDSLGRLWLATYGGGLNRFDYKTNQFKYYTKDETNNNSISSDLAWTMNFDRKGNLWVGTQAAGLNLLTNENLLADDITFQHYDLKDGLRDQTVYAIVNDDAGNIWFSSNNGISRYSPEHQRFKHFDNRHGLIDLEFNHGAVFKSSNELIYFGSAKGFTSIDPHQILRDQPAPEVRLNNILKLNEPMEFTRRLSELKEVIVGYDDPLISFEYVGLNYSDPEATRYKYRLLGFDEEWIDAGKLRRATYTNLPAGSYTLEVIAANSDNIWSNPGYSIDVIVKPAPWNTWWAYLLYVMLLAIFLLSYSRILNKKLVTEQKQKLLLKEQVIEKTQKYVQKNLELELVNSKLEKSAIIDRVTGVKSRRYLDIYIEQTSQLMSQIHQNLLPVQRGLLPRLYILMIEIKEIDKVSNGQLINLTELMTYSRNVDDLVVRWSENVFAIIGYEKDNSAAQLAERLCSRFDNVFKRVTSVNMSYSYFPFNIEQPMSLSWDQTSVLMELAIQQVALNKELRWVGLMNPSLEHFDYVEAIKSESLEELGRYLTIKCG